MSKVAVYRRVPFVELSGSSWNFVATAPLYLAVAPRRSTTCVTVPRLNSCEGDSASAKATCPAPACAVFEAMPEHGCCEDG